MENDVQLYRPRFRRIFYILMFGSYSLVFVFNAWPFAAGNWQLAASSLFIYISLLISIVLV